MIVKDYKGRQNNVTYCVYTAKLLFTGSNPVAASNKGHEGCEENQ
jgi:hypothetical protein